MKTNNIRNSDNILEKKVTPAISRIKPKPTILVMTPIPKTTKY